MVGATGLKGIVAVQTGFDHKSTAGAHTAVPHIHRIAYGIEIAVQGQVEVQFKPEIYLL
jgi:hypothetical protein